jgi:hypothetical protein
MVLLCLAAGLYAEKSMENVAKTQTTARGKIEAGTDRNGNTDVYIRTWDLARQKKDAAFYVVWFQPKDAAAQNAGVIKMDDDQQGAFRTLTPLKDFDVFVTVESDAAATSPSGEEILRTHVAKDEIDD